MRNWASSRRPSVTSPGIAAGSAASGTSAAGSYSSRHDHPSGVASHGAGASSIGASHISSSPVRSDNSTATGPAVGQGGDFADRFSLTRASAEGDVVVLELDPLPDQFVLSDLSAGPVLYATC